MRNGKPFVDSAKAVALHQDGWKVADIAGLFNVQCPAIYRAFRKHNYATQSMLDARARRVQEHLMPPTGVHSNEPPPPSKSDSLAADALPVTKLDPCFRCGTRGDLKCGCRKSPVGWHVG